MGFQIAIDGPAGAGKSTIAKLVAKKLGFTYMDTGAMYRAIGILFDEQEVFPETDEDIVCTADKAAIELKYEDGNQHIYLNGNDVTVAVRTENAGKTASKVSTYPYVRKKLVELQQSMSDSMNVVMDGRDIGTVVLPNAQLKIFMEANVLVRAKRRLAELLGKGEITDIDTVIEDIKARDYQDTHRAVSPLKKAEDAIAVDTSEMNIDEVVAKILELYREVKDR